MIMILSGTQDGREIINLLLEQKYPLIVTTATTYGGSLIEETENCKIISQKLNRKEMEDFIINNGIKLIIDATHPYAAEVSQNAIYACKNSGIIYFRYQRAQSKLDQYEDILRHVYCYDGAIQYLKEIQGNILLTTGSKVLENFAKALDKNRLFPRVLPTSDVIKKCEDLGIIPSNIIAMQGPFSVEMNVEMIRKYKIDILVSKDSGNIGGTLEKFEAARRTGIPVLLINRPKIAYENVFSEMGALMDKVREIYGKILSNHA